MKKIAFLLIFILLIIMASGCHSADADVQIVATTLPVYEFSARLCEGTELSVSRLITENVSCLHDYTLQVSQMQMVESADAVIISGAGLEAFIEDVLGNSQEFIDASAGTHIHAEGHTHDEHSHDEYSHDGDPHIWLAPENAKIMAQNICSGLSALYPQYQSVFEDNLSTLLSDLDQLQAYGEETLSDLSCREIITFHDGFGYFAEAFDLTILEAVEEESGSEASASELIELIKTVSVHSLPAIFTETNGSTSAAEIICAETGVNIYTLDMVMAGDSYFQAMYHNINTIKEALE